MRQVRFTTKKEGKTHKTSEILKEVSAPSSPYARPILSLVGLKAAAHGRLRGRAGGYGVHEGEQQEGKKRSAHTAARRVAVLQDARTHTGPTRAHKPLAGLHAEPTRGLTTCSPGSLVFRKPRGPCLFSPCPAPESHLPRLWAVRCLYLPPPSASQPPNMSFLPPPPRLLRHPRMRSRVRDPHSSWRL